MCDTLQGNHQTRYWYTYCTAGPKPAGRKLTRPNPSRRLAICPMNLSLCQHKTCPRGRLVVHCDRVFATSMINILARLLYNFECDALFPQHVHQTGVRQNCPWSKNTTAGVPRKTDEIHRENIYICVLNIYIYMQRYRL